MAEERPLSVLDSLFLWGEFADTMMHVGGLVILSPPPDAGPTYLREMIDEALAAGSAAVQSPWNRKLRHPSMLRSPVQAWVTDERMDLEYHVRRDALPSPGSERELGILVSRLHSNKLDLRRPPWEMHIIEGLEHGRYAMYVKVHHSLVDGYTAMRLLSHGLSRDPGTDKPLFFFIPPPKPRRRDDENGGLLGEAAKLAGGVKRHTSSALTLATRVATPVFRSREEPELGLRAPHSILNSRIGRNRRFATQQYTLSELKQLGSRYDATINDVMVAVIGGGLRKFLSDMDQLPQKSLVAFLPVNVRPKDDVGGGNAVGAILARVGTDIEDPVERLLAVRASTRAAKARLEGMTKQGILAYSAYLMAPTGLQAIGAITGITSRLLPTNFNLCISNVPGPRQPLYMRGSRLEASYPVSIPIHGMALNITVQSYDDTMGVGFVGCRDTLPHLQRLAVYTGEALDALRNA